MQYIQDKQVFLNYIFKKCHCINAGQTKEERISKYKLCRALGNSVVWARVKRDWRWNSIAKSFGYKDFKTMEASLSNES